MYIKMSDFFMGMGKQFTIEVLDIAEKLFQNNGEVLFREGEPAKHFFVLLKGRVKLSLGETGPVVYMVRQPGEIIGWSGLIGRDRYSASGECMEATNLLKFDRDVLLDILKKYPRNEALLFRRLAEMLGNRLLDLYPTIS
ncbi:MAG: cyclic nucleotide-binding domain-containing protein [Desulfobacterales bacterium]|jgi:CRP-like cAMP-binding protein|nr:cyclic nucleotide-binding domain-containing protein [Desulfobacterales bacterium]MDH3876729.1 cyclic nucleotide-binding domain-containing protein [Desulfobacterales bacterium]MDH4009733.1 cyclic nucleotide-binding domain-containing protein [Desulfobacterales bacterium]